MGQVGLWECGKCCECWCGGVRMGVMYEIAMGEGKVGDHLRVGKENYVRS